MIIINRLTITIFMAKVSHANLQPNPFITYRDPQTGLWKVLKSASANLNNSPNEYELQDSKSV